VRTQKRTGNILDTRLISLFSAESYVCLSQAIRAIADGRCCSNDNVLGRDSNQSGINQQMLMSDIVAETLRNSLQRRRKLKAKGRPNDGINR